MKYVIAVMTVIILSLGATTAHFRRLHVEAIGLVGVERERLLNASTALLQCQSDARLNDALGVQLDNNIQDSVSVYDKYSSILKSENKTHTDVAYTLQNKKEKDTNVGGVDETNEVGLSDTLPSGVSRMLNEAYNELYPSEERATKDIHKQ